jgi:hypothetical protein
MLKSISLLWFLRHFSFLDKSKVNLPGADQTENVNVI